MCHARSAVNGAAGTFREPAGEREGVGDFLSAWERARCEEMAGAAAGATSAYRYPEWDGAIQGGSSRRRLISSRRSGRGAAKATSPTAALAADRGENRDVRPTRRHTIARPNHRDHRPHPHPQSHSHARAITPRAHGLAIRRAKRRKNFPSPFSRNQSSEEDWLAPRLDSGGRVTIEAAMEEGGGYGGEG